MKKTQILSLATALLTLFAFNLNAQEKYTIDPASSTITWNAEKVTGSHEGSVNFKSGAIEMSDEKLTGGNFQVDMTTIVNTDLEGEWKTKLEGHLKSDDFFGIEKFPISEFVITDVKPMENDQYKIGGNMTIKGKTNRVEFTATVTDDDKGLEAKGNMVIDRSEYDVRYGSGSFANDLGDKTIYDDFTLTFEIKAKK